MPDATPRPNGFRRLVQRLAATRPMSWLLSHTLHYLDRPLLRLSGGRWSAAGLLTGLPIVMLTTTGSRSGKKRTSPLVGLVDGENVVLIASYFGRRHHPAWYHNLRRNTRVQLSFNGRSDFYLAREAVEAEYPRLWQEAVELYAGYAAYRERAHGRHIPIVVLTPAGNLSGLSDVPEIRPAANSLSAAGTGDRKRTSMKASSRWSVGTGSILLVGVAALAVVALSLRGPRQDLAGTQWKLATLNGHPPVASAETITLAFEAGGKAGGNSGCNAYGGNYSANGSALSITGVAATLRACTDQNVNDQEAEFYQALSDVASFDIANGQLTLTDASGATVLVFVPA